MSLLTTPLEDRAIFVDSGFLENPPPGEIVSILGADGSMYSCFDLVLPKNTVITRPAPSILLLENNRLVLELAVLYQGFSTYVPSEYYVDVRDKMADVKKIDVRVSATIKRRGLLQNTG